MSDRRFSLGVVLLFIAVALGIAAGSLGSGLFFGYLWGRSAGRAQALAEGPNLLPRVVGPPLEDLPPGSEQPQTRRARPPFLGVSFRMINPELAQQEELAANQGAWVTEVVPGSPAEEAGLQAGDIIQSVDGQEVNDRHPLPVLILPHRPGDRIGLQILRGDAEHRIEVELGARHGSGFLEEGLIPGLEFPGFHFQLQCFPEPCPFFEGQH